MIKLLTSMMPQKNISANDISKGLNALIYDGMCTQSMLVLTSGAFLTAFAVKLGASNIIIGTLATAIAPIVGAVAETFFKAYNFTLTVTCTHLSNTFQLDLLDYWGLDFVFLVACIIGVYALGTLSKVREPGEKLVKDVYSELMVEISQSLRTMSTVMGLKFIFKSPKDNRKVSIQVLYK